MKNLFIAALVIGLMAAVAVPALGQDSQIPPVQDPDVCDVSFDVDVLKLKGILILKTVNKAFNFDLDLGVEIVGFPQWAEVEAFKCDKFANNVVSITGFNPTNNISNAFIAFIGVAQVNLAAGALINQGNVLAAGLTGKIGDQNTFGLSMVEAAVEKTNFNNTLSFSDSVTTDNIEGAFNKFEGLGQVNLSAGVLNNQNNVLVLGTNLNTSGLVAENDTFLSMSNTNNELEIAPLANTPSSGVVTTANIEGSYNNYTGVAQVNLGPGVLSNQANIFSVSYAGR
jgi:hypothetical protein